MMTRLVYMEKHEKILYWYSFLSVFSVPMIVFNLNIYLFPFLLLFFKQKFNFIFKYRGIEQIFIILFGIAAIIGTIETFFNLNKGNFSDAMIVLPNYLYWCIMILFLVSHKDNLNYNIIIKAIFHGLLLLIIYHFFLQNLGLNKLPFFKGISPNTFAFLMICFSPICVYYILKTRGFLLAIIFILLFSFCALMSHSRSGSTLVLIGNLAISLHYYFNQKRLFIATFLFLSVITFSFLKSGILWDTIYKYNPRMYTLIFDREWVRTRDTSYLIRKAQIEKGFELFSKYPMIGIGLNNFEAYSIYQPLNFEGRK